MYSSVEQLYVLVMCIQALMSLFVLASKDGWVNIMYSGLDAVGVDLQVRTSYHQQLSRKDSCLCATLHNATAMPNFLIGLLLYFNV